jgi:hypothetical protein
MPNRRRHSAAEWEKREAKQARRREAQKKAVARKAAKRGKRADH